MSKIIHTSKNGNQSAMVRKIADEYRVRHFIGDAIQPESEYFTDDKDDAISTANAMVGGNTSKRKTNTEMLNELMEYAKTGPLMQAFILEAISKYATRCSEADASVFDSPMLNGAAWKACAIEAKQTIDNHLKG